MKNMLMGIFLLILSIWFYIFGVVDDVPPFNILGVFLPILAIIIFLFGFFDKGDKK
ncbi:MAG: hypothetical protein R3Y58_02335 [Eubacteriales bacterium]